MESHIATFLSITVTLISETGSDKSHRREVMVAMHVNFSVCRPRSPNWLLELPNFGCIWLAPSCIRDSVGFRLNVIPNVTSGDISNKCGGTCVDKPNLQQGEPLRVFVADATRMSSQLIADALKRSRNNFDVRALTGNSSEVFLAVENSRPHVAVVSSQLEDGQWSGFKVLHQLRASNSKIPAIMLLDSSDREAVIDAFRAGARGVFCRGSAFDALPKCIRRIHEGQIWISNAELEFLLEVVTNLKTFQIQNTGKALLTPREQDVVRLVAEGMRNQEIGEALSLGENTVRNYIFRVFEKLGLSSRVELVLYALSTETSFDKQSPRDLAAKSAPALPMVALSRTMASRK